MTTEKMIRNLVLAALVGTSCSPAFATEEEQAREGCERVEALRVAEMQANGQKAVPVSCQYVTRPASYWQCIEGKMESGNSWFYSSQQCKATEVTD